MTITSEGDRPTATRTLQYVAGDLAGQSLLIRLEGPYEDPVVGWVCKYTIERAASPVVTTETRGGDSLQALMIAIQGLTLDLKADAPNLSWSGGPTGEIGIPFCMLFPNGMSTNAAYSTRQLQADVEHVISQHEKRIKDENERFFEGDG